MKKSPLTYLFILLSLYLNSQVRIDTLRLYFDINQNRSSVNDQRIDSLVKAVGGNLVKIKVLGYADFLHSTTYNQSLSGKRAEGVKSQLQKKFPQGVLTSISSKGMGEKFSKDNGSKEGDAFQRRVDVIVEPFTIIHEDPQPNTDVLEAKPRKIEDLAKGETIAVDGLNFEPGKHFLAKGAMPVLNNLLKTLQNNPTLKIEIQGHICCLDGEEDGMDMDTHEKNLSVTRAKAIYDFLISNGIDKGRLSYKGFGHSKPKVFPERTPADEQMNRRVEVMIVEE